MSNIFYVSSWGGSATRWLACSLDLHPEIRCYHGSRTLPDAGEETNELSADDFCIQLERLAQPFAGSVHGFHELTIHQAVTSRGGRFGVSVREPILRIASLYQHYQPTDEQSRQQRARFLHHYANLNDQAIVKLQQDGILAAKDQTDEQFLDDLCFAWLVIGTVKCDLLLSHLPDEQLFRMEDYTQDPLAFRNMFHYLTQNRLDCSDDYLDRVFAQGKINRHQKSPQAHDPGRIFLQWPDNRQVLVIAVMNHFKPVFAFYQRMNYPAPALLQV